MRLHEQTTAAAQRVSAVKAELYPHLDLWTRYTMVGRDQNSFEGPLTALKGYEWAGGLRLTWNLFNGFQTQHRITKARAEELSAGLREMRAQKGLLDALREATFQLQIREEAVSLSTKRLSLHQAQERIAKTRLELKQITPVQLESFKIETEEAASKVALARIDLVLAKIECVLARF